MNIYRLIRLIISGFNHIPKVFRDNDISWTTEMRGKSLIRGCKIGRYGYIGPNCFIQNTLIGNYVSIAPNVHVGGMEHAIDDLSTNTWLSDKGKCNTTTVIEHDAWIAACSIIKQGVTIGRGAVVGANSFVNRDVPPYAIVVGNPAKIIRYRFERCVIDKLLDSDYYKLDPISAQQKLRDIKKACNL